MNKIKITSNIKNHKGFTVLELIIATTVFSVMLLLTTTGMIQIGRVYYKGLITSKTQETARSISEEIVRTVQFGGDAQLVPGATANFGGLVAQSVCMNNIRYTYSIDRRLAADTTARTSRHVLWLDVIRDRADCQPVNLTLEDPGRPTGAGGLDNSAGAQNTDLSPAADAQRRELLSTNMRLSQFDMASAGSGDLVSIRLRVMYGEDDVIVDPDSDPTTPNSNCVPARIGGQFCAFSSLDSFAKRRL
jgi:prepilin-type N-terminal cleavage/methylation domain-containing protein